MIDTANGIAWFRPVGAAAEGTPMASASAGSGGGCGCTAAAQQAGSSGGGGTAEAEQALAEVLTQQHTPASPDGLASYAYDLLIGADGAGSLVRQLLERYDGDLQVGLRC